MSYPTPTEIHYFILCPRKAWWFTHGLEQEHVDGNAGAENVALGKLIHEDSFADALRKEVLIDERMRIDFTDAGIVHEVKKSRGGEKATRMQVLYALWYLKHEKDIETTAVIHYPTEKRTVALELTESAEREVEAAIAGLDSVRAMPTPPPVADPMKICDKCAYADLCWG